MPVYVCSGCGARNTDQGHCLVCGASLGSLPKALGAAIASGAILAGAWIGLAVATGTIHGELAIGCGALVSATATRVSGGRGFLYQAIATGVTIVAIAAAQLSVVWLLWDQLLWRGPVPPRPWPWDVVTLFETFDGLTEAFALLGVMGGFWIWREGGGAER